MLNFQKLKPENHLHDSWLVCNLSEIKRIKFISSSQPFTEFFHLYKLYRVQELLFHKKLNSVLQQKSSLFGFRAWTFKIFCYVSCARRALASNHISDCISGIASYTFLSHSKSKTNNCTAKQKTKQDCSILVAVGHKRPQTEAQWRI